MTVMTWTYAVALTVGLVGCVADLRSRRIPNLLTFGAAALGVVVHTAVGGSSGFLQAMGGWGVGLLVFIVPFALGGLGGGDVKLLAALGAWLGPVDALWVALFTGISGGILAVVVALANGYLRQALSNIWLLLAHWRVVGLRPMHEISLEGSSGPRLAYAVPIFVATVVTVWLRS